MTRFYLAGPMTGYPSLNHPAFHDAAEVLRDEGFGVVSPAEMDDELGIEPNAADPFAKLSVPPAEIMRADLQAVLDCDGIVLLPGWQASKGARLERIVAESTGRQVYLYDPDGLIEAPAWNHPAIWRPTFAAVPTNNDHEDDCC